MDIFCLQYLLLLYLPSFTYVFLFGNTAPCSRHNNGVSLVPAPDLIGNDNVVTRKRYYTHYYGVRNAESREWKKAWKQLVQDVPLIIQYTGVLVRGPDAHPSLPPQPPLIDLRDGIYINGVGNDGHESLHLHPDGRTWSVQTDLKPYDLVVGCILLRAFLLAPNEFSLGSDGEWGLQGEWNSAYELYRSIWPQGMIWCPWEDDRPKEEDGRRHSVGFFLERLERRVSKLVCLRKSC